MQHLSYLPQSACPGPDEQGTRRIWHRAWCLASPRLARQPAVCTRRNYNYNSTSLCTFTGCLHERLAHPGTPVTGPDDDETRRGETRQESRDEWWAAAPGLPLKSRIFFSTNFWCTSRAWKFLCKHKTMTGFLKCPPRPSFPSSKFLLRVSSQGLAVWRERKEACSLL